MNCGTSKRDTFTPMGCQAFASVQMANLLTSRLGLQNMFIKFQKGDHESVPVYSVVLQP